MEKAQRRKQVRIKSEEIRTKLLISGLSTSRKCKWSTSENITKLVERTENWKHREGDSATGSVVRTKNQNVGAVDIDCGASVVLRG